MTAIVGCAMELVPFMLYTENIYKDTYIYNRAIKIYMEQNVVICIRLFTSIN